MSFHSLEKAREGKYRQRQKYAEIKAEVAKLEEENFSRLIMFNSGGGWYKMAGNSLLIYYFMIVEELKMARPILQPDTDYTDILFEDGVLSFRGPEAVEKRLEKLEAIKRREDRGERGADYTIFELNFRVSQARMGEFRREIKYEEERALSVLKPVATLEPEVYDRLRHIQKRVFETVRKMSVFEREYNGNLMAEYSRKMIKYYLLISEGGMEEKAGWKKILETNRMLMMEIVFATELRVWRQDVAVAIGAELIEVRRKVERILERTEKKTSERSGKC